MHCCRIISPHCSQKTNGIFILSWIAPVLCIAFVLLKCPSQYYRGMSRRKPWVCSPSCLPTSLVYISTFVMFQQHLEESNLDVGFFKKISIDSLEVPVRTRAGQRGAATHKVGVLFGVCTQTGFFFTTVLISNTSSMVRGILIPNMYLYRLCWCCTRFISWFLLFKTYGYHQAKAGSSNRS